ncbi:tetratricopeptide repeat protein [Fluviispira multicolorata]|uniref:Tetratricopeptide repeat protein n=1 Tax=Fluviispira multicolorata TaxID=2654512 RepID=A0A833JCE0_9BACT|nr:hypothetical protein [Fluviispira multicolorata]KAB8030671.1 hypothetical protein GCL57_06765 [Fluviispira multicolorata]
MKKYLIYIVPITLIYISNNIYSLDGIFIPKIPEKSEVVDLKKKINNEQIEQEKMIFRSIFDLHFKNWKEEFNREIEYEDFKSNKNDKVDVDENNRVKEEKFNKVLDFLNKRIEIKHNKIIQAEASFKLALYSYFTKKIDALKAIDILEKGLSGFPVNEDNLRLFIRMNLFIADLLLSNDKHKEAQNYFKAIVLQKLDANIYREEIVRAFIGLGDTYYSIFQFKEASKYYLKAKDFSDKGWMLSEEKLAFLLGEINIRLLWSTFRNADYKKSSEYAYQFSREKGRFEKYFKENIMNDIIRVGAISLYECKDLEFYKKIASDSFAGDFAKKMIVKSFYYFASAGYPYEVEKYARAVENRFYSSREFPSFIKAFLLSLKQANNMNKYYELSYFGSAFIAKDSVWKSRLVLTQEEEDFRRELIADLSDESAKYYYNMGLQNHLRSDFLKSAEIYSSRLNESFSFDAKGILYQSYAQSLFKAQEFDLAIKASEESLKYPLDVYSKKISWFQLLNITRMQTENTKDTHTLEYKKYESIVDGFNSNFPLDPESRTALFESGKRAEILGDFINAKDRYERILSSPPLESYEQSNVEKNKVSLALALLLQRMNPENKDVMDSAGNLEKYIKDYSVSKFAQNIVHLTNHKIAIEYAKSIKSEGKIRESAKFLEMWSKNYNHNPNITEVLVESISIYAELQDWDYILNLTRYFEDKILDLNKVYILILWQAKALDALLQFRVAAQTYEKAFDLSNNKIDNKLMLSALERSSEIYQYLFMNEDSIRVKNKLYQLLIKVEIDPIKLAKFEYKYGEYLLENKKYDLSRKIFLNGLKRKKLNKDLFEKIEIGLLNSNLSLEKNPTVYENKIIKFLENHLSFVEKDNSESSKNILLSLINSSNKYDQMKLDNEILYLSENLNLKHIQKIESTLNFIKARLKVLKKSTKLINEYNDTEVLYGKILLNLAGYYRQVYYKIHKNDNYLVKADQIYIEAKKYLYNALMNEDLGSEQKLIVSMELSRFGKRDFFIKPEINIEDFTSEAALYNLVDENLKSSKYIAKEYDKK